MNVLLSTKETKRLVDIISGDTQHVITFQDFCSLLLLLPPESATEMFHDWISENAWDVGEGLTLPDDTGDVEGWMLLVAGGCAGAVSRTATAPVDRVKTLLQAQVPAPKQAKRRDGAASHGAAQSHTKRSHPPKASATAGDTVAEAVKQQVRRPRSGAIPVNGVLDGFRTIYKEGGWPGFWRGNGANVIKVAPETAVKFYVYESMRKWICADEHAVTIPERFISGAVAGAVGQVAIYPLEIAKTRMALARKGEYRGILDCLLKILRFEGPSCMYRGMGASLMGIVPYAGTDLTIYSLLRDAYGAKYPDEPPGAATLLGCGAIASTCGQVVAYPLQLVRTRLQAQGMHKRPVVYQGILDCVRKTVAEGGIRGLYRGMLPNFLKALPAISISYVVYEKTKRGLRDIDPKRLPWE